jgi:hypothetical protein
MMTYTDQKQLSRTCGGIDEDTRAVWGRRFQIHRELWVYLPLDILCGRFIFLRNGWGYNDMLGVLH